MKKLLFALSTLFLMVSCSGKGDSEKAQQDSVNAVDTTAILAESATVQEITLDSSIEAPNNIAVAEPVSVDTIPSAKEKETKDYSQYDGLVSELVSAISNLEKVSKPNTWDDAKIEKYSNKYVSLRNKVNKIKKKLSPEQKAKVNKAEKRYLRLLSGVIAG